jgi:riboflavin synthase
MYTGLVADYGEVQTITHADEGVTVRVQTELANELALGDSVAVNGVCLTTTALADQSFEADVMNETLRRSTLGGLAAGDHVNLELSMRADGRLDGHFVQGHIDGVGEVSEVRTDGCARVVTIRGSAAVMRYIVEKGSVAVDGVSLTVAHSAPESFEVSLIPETQERTTLGRVTPGSHVNLEVDVLAKYVERLSATDPSPSSSSPGS